MRFNLRRSVGLGVLSVCPTLALAGAPHPACVPSEEVEKIVSRHYEGGADEMAGPIRDALASRPTDVHLNRTYQDVYRGDRKELLERYRAEATARPRDPSALYLYGRVLANNDDPGAEKVLLAALEVDPGFPWAHFALARFYDNARPDAAKAQLHLAAAIDQCPNSALIMRRLGDLPSAQVARRGEVVRAQLARAADPSLAPQLEALWAAEFKTQPPKDHAAVRERVSHDLELLRVPSLVGDRRVLDALLSGYRMVGDDARLDWAIEETARKFPDDGEAQSVTFERFHARHRRPERCDTAAMQAYDRTVAEASRRWVELWPHDPGVRFARLDGLAGCPDVAAEDLKAAIDAFLEAAKARPSDTPARPISFAAAGVLVDNRRALDRVPGLIDQGLAEIRSRAPQMSGADRDTERSDEERRRIAEGLAILVNARLEQEDVEAARAVFADLVRVVPLEERRRAPDPKIEVRMREERAIGEVFSVSVGSGCEEMTPEAIQELTELLAPELAVLMAAHREKMPEPPSMIDRAFADEKSLPLPEFELHDLSGKTWRPSDLRGKVVLIHAWMDFAYANEMLPWIEELSGRLAKRSDVAILTINADENPGKIGPVVRDHGYTFPVVFSQELASKLGNGRLSVPNTWIVDRQGVVRRESSGVVGGGRAEWLDKVVRLIDEIGAPPPAKP
jgi:cytochrome c biogenesis protein CcmG, thiol:disulfide interchange protein DsbE